ncbi:hypothetical protein HNR42_000942 [Deinobacterium chartae]|uniref:DUF1565 domain-containing protein n=1 Tax=Deinobacterium chartae TaxID=521158 RepID=A0A841I0M4_9DEIO|nr:DUF1565 domain-containing protein [Deinobacterium chartae]MBB6097525.1 hypothetical protein [Deinobacterium chartae]
MVKWKRHVVGVPGVVLCVLTACGGGSDGTPQNPQELYVSLTGNDLSGNGSLEKPFKTLNRALQAARSGQTVRLDAGVYDAASGQAYGSGIRLPAGVNLDRVAGNVVLKGTSDQKALLLEGDATINHLTFEGFGLAIDTQGHRLTADGLRFFNSGGIAADRVGAVVTLSNFSFEGGVQGVSVMDGATATLQGGTVKNYNRGCLGGAYFYNDGSTLTLSDVQFSTSNGVAVDSFGRAGSPATTSLISTHFDRVGLSGCGRSETLSNDDGSTLNIVGSQFHGHSNVALDLIGGEINIRGSAFHNNGTAMYIGTRGGGSPMTSVRIENTLISGNTRYGIEFLTDLAVNVEARGVTWNPGVNGATAAGTYPAGTVIDKNTPGVTTSTAGNNFYIPASSAAKVTVQ